MKNLKLVLIFSILFSCYSAAQNQESSGIDSTVDIKALVAQQIIEIKEKEKSAETRKTVQQVPAQKLPSKKIVKAEMNESLLSKKDMLKIFIILEASLIAALVILWRRRNYNPDAQLLNKLRKNIRLLREERLATYNDAHLSKIRSALQTQPIKVDDRGRDIITKARKYSISKGEVHLAAKLKMISNSR